MSKEEESEILIKSSVDVLNMNTNASDPFTKDDFTYSNVQYYYTEISEEIENLNSTVDDFEDDTDEKAVDSTIEFWLTIRDIQALTTKLLEAKKLLGKDTETIIQQIYAVSRGDTSTQT